MRGSLSGAHEGTLHLSDDGETLVFEPDAPFAPGEEVTWRLGGGLRTSTRGAVPPQESNFFISGTPDASRQALGQVARQAAMADFPDAGSLPARSPSTSPETLPPLHPIAHGPHSPGYFFLTDFHLSDENYASHLMIVDDEGVPIRTYATPSRSLDFKRQPNGWLTFFDTASGTYKALDADFNLVDEFRCGNGYTTDLHDLRLLPNGHALLMSYDVQPMDLSAVVPGGQPRALVVGLIIQELDRSKRVVFQWRSWDGYAISDVTDRDLTGAVIDYAHGNSIEKDRDGDLILSSRHMDEVTKISRRTGEVLWRWGGKNNQFRFIDDPLAFSHQHDVRRIANGNITLFDNGFYHDPPLSRAVEYRLDEVAKTATLVWEYRSPSGVSFAMGSVQRLATGNTVIGWGSLGERVVTEVTPAGEVVAGLAFDPPLVSYRSFRFEWPPPAESVMGTPGDPPGDVSRSAHPRALEVARVSGPGTLPVQIRVTGGASVAHRVTVYDLRGRSLRRWSAFADTEGRIRWDGTASNGAPCASGVYFVRVEREGRSASTKVIIAR